MKIIDYECGDYDPKGWEFDPVRFGEINLLVGDSGMGKTRLLNTIFNIGTSVARKNFSTEGEWKMTFSIDEIEYQWEVKAGREFSKEVEVEYEKLEIITEGRQEVILVRDKDKFTYKDKQLPKLQRDTSSIKLLSEEDDINPIYNGFSKILRRRFFESDISQRCVPSSLPSDLLRKMNEIKDVEELYPMFQNDLSLNAGMYLLKQYFNELYVKITNYFQATFQFVDVMNVLELQQVDPIPIDTRSNVPLFCIKEKGYDDWIPLHELSSGMQKTLLVLVDFFTLPNGSIYLIDEYENSLGINAINFFPELLGEEDFNIQFFITSHHPYIINKIPAKDWYILHRMGRKVRILHGDAVIERFGLSKQQSYIKLLNDPFFKEGKI
jgi:hypothetical protein